MVGEQTWNVKLGSKTLSKTHKHLLHFNLSTGFKPAFLTSSFIFLIWPLRIFGSICNNPYSFERSLFSKKPSYYWYHRKLWNLLPAASLDTICLIPHSTWQGPRRTPSRPCQQLLGGHFIPALFISLPQGDRDGDSTELFLRVLVRIY